MTEFQVTSAQVEQIANAFARTDFMAERPFRRSIVQESLNNWRYHLYSAEQQAIQAEAAEREAAAKALELAEAGDYEAGKRAWQALKVLRPNLDGTDTFEDLPHAKLLEYVTLAAGATGDRKPRVFESFADVPDGMEVEDKNGHFHMRVDGVAKLRRNTEVTFERDLPAGNDYNAPFTEVVKPAEEAAVAEPAHVWKVGDKARVLPGAQYESGHGKQASTLAEGATVTVTRAEHYPGDNGNIAAAVGGGLAYMVLPGCLEPITEPTHGVSIGDQVIITNKTRWISHNGEQDVPDTLHGKIVTVTKLGSIADDREVEVQEAGQAGGWRMLPDGLAKVFHGRDDWEAGAKAVVTGPATYAHSSVGELELGDVVTLRSGTVDNDGDLYARGENGKGPWIRAASLTRVIA